jgi:hypothetical protein
VTAHTTRVFLRVAAAIAVSLIGFARALSAQALVPPAGEGNVAVSYQNLFARGHLDLNGNRMEGESGRDPTQTHAIVLDGDFGLSDRLAIGASLPYIGSRYEGDFPHRVMGTGPTQEWDNGDYHGTFQDFRISVRYNVVRRPFFVTPSFELIIPSHHYPSLAHAAVGKDLRAYVPGVSVGGFLDSLLPGLFFQGHVTYARAQKVVGIRPNRTRLDGSIGYFFTPRLSVRFLQNYQVTHHGIDLVSFTPMTEGIIHGSDIPFTAEYRRNHDRLQRSNYFTLGGGFGFALTDTLDVFVDAARMAWGENVHPLRAITVGVNTHFTTRRETRP